jgi:hypothetical protein
VRLSCESSLRFLGVSGPKVLLLLVEGGADSRPVDVMFLTPAVVLGGAENTAFGEMIGALLLPGLAPETPIPSGAPLLDRIGQGVRLIYRRADSGN